MPLTSVPQEQAPTRGIFRLPRRAAYANTHEAKHAHITMHRDRLGLVFFFNYVESACAFEVPGVGEYEWGWGGLEGGYGCQALIN